MVEKTLLNYRKYNIFLPSFKIFGSFSTKEIFVEKTFGRGALPYNKKGKALFIAGQLRMSPLRTGQFLNRTGSSIEDKLLRTLHIFDKQRMFNGSCRLCAPPSVTLALRHFSASLDRTVQGSTTLRFHGVHKKRMGWASPCPMHLHYVQIRRKGTDAEGNRTVRRLVEKTYCEAISKDPLAAPFGGRGAKVRSTSQSFFELPKPYQKKAFKVFFNQCFDKGRLKNFVLWFLVKYGENKTIYLVEHLKNIGFYYASKAGISLGIDDLKIPPKKATLIYDSEKLANSTINQYMRGEITGVERFQRLIDTWHRTSEILKQEVIDHFEATDVLNPVYMMAFSGARGNISQVRQLVGMRGLMADPQGQILDFPIRSNFREGLTLTEYIISSYGARKGIVDTALRTANAGYLTRRLVDVAQHVIISNFDCGTKRGIFLTNMKEGNKIIYSLHQRIVGRILARDLFFDKKLKIASRDEEITQELAFKIGKNFDKVFVRSSLTCEKLICQLCYGWSLAQGKLVSIGEAVGVVAAQSIGEPGTQLTMRTFHTGGVFSGDISDQIKAPYNGIIEYISPIPGTLIRTPEGKISFLTKSSGSFVVYKLYKDLSSKNFETNVDLHDLSYVRRKPEGEQVDQSKSQKQVHRKLYKIPPYTLLYMRNGQNVFEKEVIAQISSISQKTNATDDAELTIKSDIEGQFYSKYINFHEKMVGPKLKKSNDFALDKWSELNEPDLGVKTFLKNDFSIQQDNNLLSNNKSFFHNLEYDKLYEAWTWGFAWILSGKIYEFKKPSLLFPIIGDFVNTKSYITQTKWSLNSNNCSNYRSFKDNSLIQVCTNINNLIFEFSRRTPNNFYIQLNSDSHHLQQRQNLSDHPLTIQSKCDFVKTSQILLFDLNKILFKKYGYIFELTQKSQFISFTIGLKQTQVTPRTSMLLSNGEIFPDMAQSYISQIKNKKDNLDLLFFLKVPSVSNFNAQEDLIQLNKVQKSLSFKNNYLNFKNRRNFSNFQYKKQEKEKSLLFGTPRVIKNSKGLLFNNKKYLELFPYFLQWHPNTYNTKTPGKAIFDIYNFSLGETSKLPKNESYFTCKEQRLYYLKKREIETSKILWLPFLNFKISNLITSSKLMQFDSYDLNQKQNKQISQAYYSTIQSIQQKEGKFMNQLDQFMSLFLNKKIKILQTNRQGNCCITNYSFVNTNKHHLTNYLENKQSYFYKLFGTKNDLNNQTEVNVINTDLFFLKDNVIPSYVKNSSTQNRFNSQQITTIPSILLKIKKSIFNKPNPILDALLFYEIEKMGPVKEVEKTLKRMCFPSPYGQGKHIKAITKGFFNQRSPGSYWTYSKNQKFFELHNQSQGLFFRKRVNILTYKDNKNNVMRGYKNLINKSNIYYYNQNSKFTTLKSYCKIVQSFSDFDKFDKTKYGLFIEYPLQTKKEKMLFPFLFNVFEEKTKTNTKDSNTQKNMYKDFLVKQNRSLILLKSIHTISFLKKNVFLEASKSNIYKEQKKDTRKNSNNVLQLSNFLEKNSIQFSFIKNKTKFYYFLNKLFNYDCNHIPCTTPTMVFAGSPVREKFKSSGLHEVQHVQDKGNFLLRSKSSYYYISDNFIPTYKSFLITKSSFYNSEIGKLKKGEFMSSKKEQRDERIHTSIKKGWVFITTSSFNKKNFLGFFKTNKKVLYPGNVLFNTLTFSLPIFVECLLLNPVFNIKNISSFSIKDLPNFDFINLNYSNGTFPPVHVHHGTSLRYAQPFGCTAGLRPDTRSVQETLAFACSADPTKKEKFQAEEKGSSLAAKELTNLNIKIKYINNNDSNNHIQTTNNNDKKSEFLPIYPIDLKNSIESKNIDQINNVLKYELNKDIEPLLENRLHIKDVQGSGTSAMGQSNQSLLEELVFYKRTSPIENSSTKGFFNLKKIHWVKNKKSKYFLEETAFSLSGQKSQINILNKNKLQIKNSDTSIGFLFQPIQEFEQMSKLDLKKYVYNSNKTTYNVSNIEKITQNPLQKKQVLYFSQYLQAINSILDLDIQKLEFSHSNFFAIKKSNEGKRGLKCFLISLKKYTYFKNLLNLKFEIKDFKQRSKISNKGKYRIYNSLKKNKTKKDLFINQSFDSLSKKRLYNISIWLKKPLVEGFLTSQFFNLNKERSNWLKRKMSKSSILSSQPLDKFSPYQQKNIISNGINFNDNGLNSNESLDKSFTNHLKNNFKDTFFDKSKIKVENIGVKSSKSNLFFSLTFLLIKSSNLTKSIFVHSNLFTNKTFFRGLSDWKIIGLLQNKINASYRSSLFPKSPKEDFTIISNILLNNFMQQYNHSGNLKYSYVISTYFSRKNIDSICIVSRKSLNLSPFLINYKNFANLPILFNKKQSFKLFYSPISNFDTILYPSLFKQFKIILNQYFINSVVLKDKVKGNNSLFYDWDKFQNKNSSELKIKDNKTVLYSDFNQLIPNMFETQCFKFALTQSFNFYNINTDKNQVTEFLYNKNSFSILSKNISTNQIRSNHLLVNQNPQINAKTISSSVISFEAKTSFYSPFNGELVYIKKTSPFLSETLVNDKRRFTSDFQSDEKILIKTKKLKTSLNEFLKENNTNYTYSTDKYEKEKVNLDLSFSEMSTISSHKPIQKIESLPTVSFNYGCMFLAKQNLISFYFPHVHRNFTFRDFLNIKNSENYEIKDTLIKFLTITEIENFKLSSNLIKLKTPLPKEFSTGPIKEVEKNLRPFSEEFSSSVAQIVQGSGFKAEAKGSFNQSPDGSYLTKASSFSPDDLNLKTAINIKKIKAGNPIVRASVFRKSTYIQKYITYKHMTDNSQTKLKYSQKASSSLLGDFYVYGDSICDYSAKKTAVQASGQIIHYNNTKVTLRKAQPIFISPKGILHKFDGEFIDPKAPVITLSYKRLKTGDIIQGIPKVEQFFEARTTKRGRLFRDSLPSLLKALYKRYQSKMPLELAVRQSFYKIQQIIVDGVHRVYKSQGVTISDKHLEVIVKQMTTKVRILGGAQTGFFPGEVVDISFVEKINQFLIKKITYEPLVLGITKASLEVDSFLSAASFQQTTKILSQAAIYKKKDFLKGLKENVILGNLIPAGTGYLVYLDDLSTN